MTSLSKAKKPTQDLPSKKKVCLALQGGGSHGAFTWGVLDRLFEDGRFEIEGITGTSAGAMNGVAVVQGMMNEGPQGARNELRRFWKSVSRAGDNSFFPNQGTLDRTLGQFSHFQTPANLIFDYLSRIFSPYELNPLQIDPLKEILLKQFDFEKLPRYKKLKLFLCATHVFTGKIRVFSLSELKPECLLATACLPTMHAAVKVDGEYYWDGGLIGNPIFFPLIYDCESPDIIYVQLTPTHRHKLPTSAREISDRYHEITNNATVVREMRAIDFVTNLLEQGLLDKKKIKRVYMHVIKNEETFEDLGWATKLNTDWGFLTHLFEEGREAADRWIKAHYEDVGVKTTANLEHDFVGKKWANSPSE